MAWQVGGAHAGAHNWGMAGMTSRDTTNGADACMGGEIDTLVERLVGEQFGACKLGRLEDLINLPKFLVFQVLVFQILRRWFSVSVGLAVGLKLGVLDRPKLGAMDGAVVGELFQLGALPPLLFLLPSWKDG